MIALYVIGGSVVLILLGYAVFFSRVPQGYEDEDGFHYGTKK